MRAGAATAAAALALLLLPPPAAAGGQSLRERVAVRALLHTATGGVAPVLTGTLLQPGYRGFGAHLSYTVIHNPLRFGIRTLATYGDRFVESTHTLAASVDARTGRFAAAATVGRSTSECAASCERSILAGANVQGMLASRRVGTARRAPRLGLGAEGSFGYGWSEAGVTRVRANALTAGAPLTLDFTVDNPTWSRDRVRRYDTRTFLFATPAVTRVHDNASEVGRAGGTLALLSGGVGVGVDAPSLSIGLTFGARRVLIRESELLLGIGTNVRW